MAHAFSLLIQEEKQREFRPNSQLNLESTSLHVNAPNLQNQNPLGARNFKTHYTANNNNMGHPLYDYCKSPGHTREKCYKLHAHLQSNSYNNQSSNSLNNQPYNQGNNPNHNQSHRFNRRKGSVANVHRTPTDMVHDNGNEQRMHDENQNVNMTKEQYGQIMNLLQHFQVGNIGGSSNNDNVTNGSFSFAGPFSEEISDSDESNGYTHSCHSPQLVNTSNSNNKNESLNMYDKHDINFLWHNKLGHVSFVKMRGFHTCKFSTKTTIHLSYGKTSQAPIPSKN
ncbi:uncharacterized protein [Nicotiana sylvestris]|uniref:uncharacterized protein n=1 Tax=Nicotiana sylvestris TaxID=4096 RepID=UPI00388C3AD7